MSTIHAWNRWVGDNLKADTIHDHYEGQECEWTDYGGNTYEGTVQTIDYSPEHGEMAMLYTPLEPTTHPDEVLYTHVSEINTIEVRP